MEVNLPYTSQGKNVVAQVNNKHKGLKSYVEEQQGGGCDKVRWRGWEIRSGRQPEPQLGRVLDYYKALVYCFLAPPAIG